MPVVGCKLSELQGRARWITRAEAARLIEVADRPMAYFVGSKEKMALGLPLTRKFTVLVECLWLNDGF